MEALFPPIWPFTAPLAKTILLIVKLLKTNTLQTSQVYYNLVPLRFWTLHTCDFYAPYFKSLLKLFSSASFSLPPPPFPSQSQPPGPRFPWIPKSERKNWLLSEKPPTEPETDDLAVVGNSPSAADFFWWRRARCFSHLTGQPGRGQTASAANPILPWPQTLSWSQTLLQLPLRDFTESQM